MLKLEQIHVVRYKVLVEGLSMRQVASQLGLSRNTVRKYVQAASLERPPAPRPRPALERVRPRLDELVANWARWNPGERLTAAGLHRQLRRESYPISCALVRAYLRERPPARRTPPPRRVPGGTR